MNKRCFNVNCKAFKDYGYRGITVCAEWVGGENYGNFKKWACSNGYEENLTLDRIDVNGNYEPSNCRWVTQKIQSNNKRINRKLTINGVTKNISEWAKISGINRSTLVNRMKSGITGELLLNKPRVCSRKCSGEKGISWLERDQKWSVRIDKKYIGSAYELEEAIRIKYNFILKDEGI